jgi:hypothetical protein
VKYVFRNFNDAIAVFQTLPPAPPRTAGGMRVLIYNWRDCESSFAGGAETYIHNIAERWAKEGHSITPLRVMMENRLECFY